MWRQISRPWCHQRTWSCTVVEVTLEMGTTDLLWHRLIRPDLAHLKVVAFRGGPGTALRFLVLGTTAALQKKRAGSQTISGLFCLNCGIEYWGPVIWQRISRTERSPLTHIQSEACGCVVFWRSLDLFDVQTSFLIVNLYTSISSNVQNVFVLLHKHIFGLNIKYYFCDLVTNWCKYSICPKARSFIYVLKQSLELCVYAFPCSTLFGTPRRKGAANHRLWSGTQQCTINLEMSKIVSVNLWLLGLLKHNPDPLVKPVKGRRRRLRDVSLVPQKLKIKWIFNVSKDLCAGTQQGNEMHILAVA